jgi:hypothetical protein
MAHHEEFQLISTTSACGLYFACHDSKDAVGSFRSSVNHIGETDWRTDMLHEFLTTNRTALITRCKNKVAKRFSPSENLSALEHGVPLFLQQLAETLRLQQRPLDLGSPPAVTEISRAASIHGADLLHQGYSVEQVVRDYGDVCQSVTELASEQGKSISTDEFRTLNRCLDDAIAEAVTSFGRTRQVLLDDQADTLQQHLTVVSAEYQRLVGIALHSYAAIKTGNVGLSGSTGTLLNHTLEELRSLAARTLPEIRLADASSPVAPLMTTPWPVRIGGEMEFLLSLLVTPGEQLVTIMPFSSRQKSARGQRKKPDLERKVLGK